MKGIVKSNEEAKKSYSTAAQEQKFAAILSEKTPEIFETQIGTIPANTCVKLEIVYLNELRSDLGGEGVLVTLPTSIAPRYGPSPLWGHMQNQIAQAQLKGKGMKVRVEVSVPDPIIGLESRTHPIAFNIGSVEDPIPTNDISALSREASNKSPMDRTKGYATMSYPTAVLQSDFVLLIKIDSPSMLKARALMERSKESQNTSALQISFTPLDLFTEGLPESTSITELIFVVDRSGSMTAGKLIILKQTLSFSLEVLQQKGNCMFNICSFGSTSEMLWRQSEPCSKRRINEAMKLILTWDANMGGTKLMSALQHAVQHRTIESNTQLIVMTDGELWDYDGVMNYVCCTRQELQDQIRFFALGIGNEVSHQMVEDIGKRGGGLSNVISVYPQGDWESGVRRMLKGAFAPDNWNCSVKLTSRLHEEQETYSFLDSRNVQAPFEIPSLHVLRCFTLYFLFESGQPPFDEVWIEGRSSNGQLVMAMIPIRDVYVRSPTIHALAAKAIIKDLEGTHSLLHSKSQQTQKSESQTDTAQQVLTEAVRIGKRWNIAGKWTSFICVDTSTEEERAARIYEPDRMEIAELMEFTDMSVFDPFHGYADSYKNGTSLLPPFSPKDHNNSYEGGHEIEVGFMFTSEKVWDQNLWWPYHNSAYEDGSSDDTSNGSSHEPSSFSSNPQNSSGGDHGFTQSGRPSDWASMYRGSKQRGSGRSQTPVHDCLQFLASNRDDQDALKVPGKYRATPTSTTRISRKSEELWQVAIPRRSSNLWDHPYSFPYKRPSSTPWDLRHVRDCSFRRYTKKLGARNRNSAATSKEMEMNSCLFDLSMVMLYPLGRVQSPSGSSPWSQLDTCPTKEALALNPIRSSFHSTIRRSDKQRLSQLIMDVLGNDLNQGLAQFNPENSELQMRQRLALLVNYMLRILLRRQLEATAQEDFLENLLTFLQANQIISDSSTIRCSGVQSRVELI